MFCKSNFSHTDWVDNHFLDLGGGLTFFRFREGTRIFPTQGGGQTFMFTWRTNILYTRGWGQTFTLLNIFTEYWNSNKLLRNLHAQYVAPVATTERILQQSYEVIETVNEDNMNDVSLVEID